MFPRKTSYTPEDSFAFIGAPPPISLFGGIPQHKEVHISCTFTWDKPLCERIARQWEQVTKAPVKLGGVAYASPVMKFEPGQYIKKNIIFTTRGCNNLCPWCCVPELEGRLKEQEVTPGNIIQDNNFLQASREHKEKVFAMLQNQSGICFRGGLEADLVDDHFCERIAQLCHANGTSRIKELWLACDTDARLPEFKKACERLKKYGFNRNKIHCYVLSYGLDMERDEARAMAVYEAGAMPFMQLFRDFTEEKTRYGGEWERFARMWQRPAATRQHAEKGTSFLDFNT